MVCCGEERDVPEVEWLPEFVPGDRAVRRRRALAGGFASPVWLRELDDGQEVVVKASSHDSAALFAAEAEGLETLSELGGLRTPRVIAVGPRSIVLEALDPQLPQTEDFWRDAGHRAAHLHSSTAHALFGWEHDGWLGLLPQRNPWDTDGYRFFAENRVLRYLGEPLVDAALAAADRRGIERLCARLPALLPDTGACLTHGDMWRNNVIADGAGYPAFLDPAVSYTWAEVDVAHMLCSGGVPESFYDAYAEVRPLERDWREHARILNLRQLLAMLAAGIPVPGIVPAIRELISVYG
jgi:fructosamine-3-kinase